jgi:hypothetical protein
MRRDCGCRADGSTCRVTGLGSAPIPVPEILSDPGAQAPGIQSTAPLLFGAFSFGRLSCRPSALPASEKAFCDLGFVLLLQRDSFIQQIDNLTNDRTIVLQQGVAWCSSLHGISARYRWPVSLLPPTFQ